MRLRSRFTRVAEVGGLAVLEDRRGVGITMMLYLATFRWALATDTQWHRCLRQSFVAPGVQQAAALRDARRMQTAPSLPWRAVDSHRC